MAEQASYQDYVEEMLAGRVAGVFIDDSGSPGLNATPPHLHADRKTWVSVIVAPDQLPDLISDFVVALSKLKRLTGATEFHFVDIYGGRRAFKGVDPSIRIELFQDMATIFNHYKLPIFVRTFDPESEAFKFFREKYSGKMGPFDFSNHEHLALFILLIDIQCYLREAKFGKPARVWVDEGFLKHAVGVRNKSFEPEFAEGHICFSTSNTIPLLQLADFAAFGLNRSQLLLSNDALSKADQRFFQIYSDIASNYHNTEARVVCLEEWKPIDPRADTR